MSPQQQQRRRPHAPEPPREHVRVQLEQMAHQGEAIGRRDGQIVFAAFGIPGEDVTVEITERHPQYLRGRVIEVHTPSPDRVTPPCQYYGQCGGCSFQHVAYQRQLDIKTEIVREQLERIGRFDQPPLRPIIGMDNPWGYRNHGRCSVDRLGRLAYTLRRSFRTMRVEECG
ncbi:MAG: TRAM domain-containing protein, partial [Chloroflexi bacterium]|nr:TRAM domain-containing protein [Chloroflexota bacterium]